MFLCLLPICVYILVNRIFLVFVHFSLLSFKLVSSFLYLLNIKFLHMSLGHAYRLSIKLLLHMLDQTT